MALTDSAQQRLAAHIRPGDRVIDATVGNGHDTLFLARQVGARGQVYGFDIQPAAIATTRKRLAHHSLNTALFHCGHEQMAAQIPAEAHGQIRAVMFNLGYLPGADKTCITRTRTTLAALAQAVSLLAENGVISVMLYPGHAGGDDEAAAVLAWSAGCGLELEVIESERISARSPRLLWLNKPQADCN